MIFLLLLLQDKPYQPMGAPADPKVAAQWNRYHSHAEATELLRKLASTFPDLCKLETLGKSHGGRDMWVVTITNFRKGAAKPAFWIDGGIHANEIQGPEVALYTAWYLLETYGRAEAITRLLDERMFYLLPMLSPDSRDAHMTRPNTTHSPRSGQRPVDDDKDGLVDEDGPDDLDKDGHITSMRIRDPNGRWKAHKEFPNLLVPCGPEERGEFTLLGAEGVDNDDDGLVNEDGDGYYDPNRDWAWNWQPAHLQWGAHHYPFSILENRMAADFVAAHPNISGAQSYHNAGGMLLRGPGAKSDRYEPSDLAVYDVIGRKGEVLLPGYRYINIAYDLYEVYGGSVDWLHQMRGIYAFTNELFTPFNLFRKEGGGWFGREEDLHLFNKQLLFDEGIVPWRAVDHPQYGKIEVGGFKKNWMRQPPSFLLEEECHRNMAFTIYHADQMPLVKVESVEVKALEGGLTQVTATLANPKPTPTRSAVDVKNAITAPDVATIEGGKVVAGLISSNRFFHQAAEQRRNPKELRIDAIPAMGAVHVRWIVKGSGPFRVTLKSVKGGSDSKEGR
jgi:hypothetical protein